MSALRRLDGQFTSLFDSDVPADVEPNAAPSGGISEGFNKTYGWIFNAESVADLERIELDRVYELPTLQFLNDLAYLKAKAAMEKEQLNKYASINSRSTT